jgi:signal transduction histidine kinase
MLPKTLILGLDTGRLRNFLLAFFLALAIPTTVLVWQAYSQLKWEAFHQFRGVAEELTNRVDARLNDMIRTADARSFADYTFLVVSGDPSAGFLQRSPLSIYPVADTLPGVLGYFQVDSAGVYSTPLLPPDGTPTASLGISDSEYGNRLQLAADIRAILADNRLVQSRQEIGARRISRSLSEPEGGYLDSSSIVSNAVEELVVVQTEPEPVADDKDDYSQQIFDRLNRPDANYLPTNESGGTLEQDHVEAKSPAPAARANSMGKVSELRLDAALQKKSEEAESEVAPERARQGAFSYDPGRAKRKEQGALPELAGIADGEKIANVRGLADLRISTFESEVDPFEFSLLDSGHFVLFRKVWRDDQRYIQGVLIDRAVFISDVIEADFADTSLATMSSLFIAYRDDVIQSFGGRQQLSFPDLAEQLNGALLYRNRLSAPLGSLELIFNIRLLPPGPGAKVLAWVTVVLAIILVGGFVALFRLGSRQIQLARQQQDFVAAVSHELKSPLTSIRMYGEMLKEGWAEEDKKQSYYEFIHDESERLSRLISNVLQLARITRNESQIELKPTTVAELMATTESKIASQIERAGFQLKINRAGDADQAMISMDDDCFAQIIINLVDNAIKFSRHAENKTIEIGSKLCSDNSVMFSVRDYGPGIPRDQMKSIFQLFYRSESELTRETVGTGIGLAIVHQLTVAMGGAVDVVNAKPGAEFRFRFAIEKHPSN